MKATVLMWQTIKNYYHLLQAALSAVFFNFPSNHIRVIGVTGTDGKTTTVHMIYEILKASNIKASMVSSIYAAIGSKTYDTGLHVTTPGSWQIQKLLRKAVDSGHKYFVLETTSHGLDQNRLAFTKIELGVLTNVTRDHFDYHKNWQKYANAKLRLLKNSQNAIVNLDDAKSFQHVSKILKNKMITYSLDQNSDFNLKNYPLKLKIPGQFNVSNALAAAAAASTLGVSRAKIIKALSSFTSVKGRMDKIDLNQKFELYIDFAHTPNGLGNALAALRDKLDSKNKNRLIAVFGAAGQRDKEKRPLMGAVANEFADILILTSEDPRGEDPQKIIQDIKKGIKDKTEGEDLFILPERRDAIEYAVNLALPGDIVALFGKGHEKSIAIKGKETPWDEYETARVAVRRKLNEKRK